MNAKNFEYSRNNIPSPSKSAYLKTLIDKVEHFIKRLRWKAFFFNRDNNNNKKSANDSDSSSEEEQTYTYGFKTSNTPPKKLHLKAFKEDLYTLIKKLTLIEE